ncbi:MAG: choice-of-anchor D domain-containing protein, partial [Methanomicrobiaceae archaeon]|nr:choice-of-anchor D domain-containing protein [Methanomicrobiaceae archaeon]
MKDRPVLVAIVLLLLVLGAFATPAISAATPEIGCNNKNYFAKDSVGVPGVERGHFKYEEDNTLLDYDLKILTNETFLDGLIHIRAQNNPSVLRLDYTQGWSTLTEDELLPPYEGLTFHYLRLLMDYNMTYLNLTVEREGKTTDVNAPIFNKGICILSDSLIMGAVFYDIDGDGIYDDGEYGIEDISVSVPNSGADTVKTDASGMFYFTVSPGQYTVSVNPAGYNNTTPTDVAVDVPIGSGAFVLFGLNGTPPTPDPAIDIEKSTNGYDADTTPGPSIPVGEPVQWTYVVTNTGNVDLENIAVTDDKLGDICTIPSLQPGESDSCTASGIAIAGLYTNVGNVTGEYDGMSVSDEDPSHYTGTMVGAAIDIEKFTNGEDADTSPGPSITVGSSVTWTYNVTNIGTVTLSDINITDDQLGDVCTISSLAPGASDTCTETGIAEPGQYSNLGTASVEYDSTLYTETDPSHYYGESGPSTATIRVWKYEYPEENPVNGWKFTVDGETKPTEPDGHVDFEVSAPGTYTVTEEIKPSWVNVSPTSKEVTVTSGVHEVYFVNFEGAKVTVCKLDQFENAVEDWHVFVDEIEQITGEDGCTVFYIEKPDTYTITEESRAGWTPIGATSYEVKVKPGEEYGPFNFTNQFEGAVLVNAEKYVSADGEDWYQSLPIPYDDDVYWKIVIENRGAVPVDITVNDTLDGEKIAVSCSEGEISSSLDPGNSSVCIIGPQSADAGIIWNELEVKGCNDGVCDTNTASAFYEGTIDAEINVEKYVSEDGIEWYLSIAVPAETPVYWKIFIENTGTHTLGLTVEDYLDGSLFDTGCTFDTLAPGENISCTTDSTPALPGIHENYVEVTGCYDEICGSDNATAEYEGTVTADLLVEKYVSVDKENWYSNLPQVPEGSDIAWKIFIENTGSHTLDIEVEDYLDSSLFDTGCTFPENLTPGENTTCIIDDSAELGSHENYVKVTGCYGDICETSDSRATYSSPIPPQPDVGVDVEKYVSIDRANWRSYIPSVPVDTPIWWQFTIYNTGSDDLDILTIGDNLHGSPITLDCEEEIPGIIPAGESYTCTFKDPEYAMEGRHMDNYVYVDGCNGTINEDSCDFDSDEAWYNGDITTDIVVKKYVSRDNKTWSDYSIEIPVGSDVYWKIVIENKGTHPLNLTAEDHFRVGWWGDWEELELTCIPEVLKAGEKISCVLGPYTAERGYVTNQIDVKGCYESRSSGEFCDSDVDYADYHGEINADIEVTKYVSGDRKIWYHRFEPQLPVGSDVYWKILIENIGAAPLDLEITDKLDYQVYVPVCDEGSLPTSLGAGESAYCIWNDTAEPGYHWNTVDVQGCFDGYCDYDWYGHSMADYMGVYEPKATFNKDVSSDNVTWDNYIELPFMDTVYWRIEIENTAQHPIDITLTDTYKGVTFTPPCLEGTLPSTLGVGEDAVCTFTATAEPPDQIISNRAFLEICYYGFCDYLESTAEYKATIDAELAVNKQVSRDNETWSDKVDVPVGGDVFWKIEVENTGTHTLNLTLPFTHMFDGQPAVTDCTRGEIPKSINPKEKATCIINGTADYGRHENYVRIQGCDQYYGSICDEKDARAVYTGTINPELEVTKQVSSNGTDWFNMPITVPIGSDIYWKITIENTGTHTLNLDVNDTLDGDPFTLECANFTEPLAPGNTTTCIIGPDPAATGSHVNSVRVDGCFEWDHPYCDTQVASSSYFGSGAPQNAAIDVEKYVLVNRTGEWVRYDGEFMDPTSFPVLFKNEPFKWEIWVENNGTVPLELNWTDNYNGIAFDLSERCPKQLDPGINASCFIDDT